MNPRLLAAVLGGKLVYNLIRLRGGGGGTLPGLVAERIAPRLLTYLSRQCSDGIVLICGTNGKTTTSRLLGDLLQKKYPQLIHNRSGSNLLRGHLSAFLEKTSWTGRVRSSLAILEVDEAVLPRLLTLIKPRALLLHNLFRDQLDRYGEVDQIAKKWLEAISTNLDSACTLVVNADDPNLAFLAQASNHSKLFYYGLDSPESGSAQPSSAVDAYLSPASGKRLAYKTYYLSHLGDYSDTGGDFKRPALALSAKAIISEAHGAGSQFSLAVDGSSTSATLPLAGLYNVYNATAMAALANTLSIDLKEVCRSLARAKGVFGRFERIAVGNKELVLCLIKNPVGATEVFRTLAADTDPHSLAILANDNFADGLDVSWYWDAGFELLGQPVDCLCAGTRAYDMALRLKYAGIQGKIGTLLSIPEGLRAILNNTSTPKCYVLATYTATIELQAELAAQGIKQAYWQE